MRLWIVTEFEILLKLVLAECKRMEQDLFRGQFIKLILSPDDLNELPIPRSREFRICGFVLSSYSNELVAGRIVVITKLSNPFIDPLAAAAGKEGKKIFEPIGIGKFAKEDCGFSRI
ncbi:hypothetical protein C0992_003079 [Termitomyces sp. T32_za158]|nr:hypothetical protein C0992_003079 [Termitomyces sp. T32_za158]